MHASPADDPLNRALARIAKAGNDRLVMEVRGIQTNLDAHRGEGFSRSARLLVELAETLAEEQEAFRAKMAGTPAAEALDAAAA